MERLDEYLKYYQQVGWCVLPCINNQKSPLPKWTDYQKVKPTEQAWTAWKSQNVTGLALITGVVSKVVIIDVDSKGDEKLHKHLCIKYGLESNVISKTRSGGYHYFYQWEKPLTGHTGVNGDKLDIRADGNLVIIPPSRAKNKDDSDDKIGSYTWVKKPKGSVLSLPKLPEVFYEYKPSGSHVDINNILNTEEGSRNDTFFKFCCKTIEDCDDIKVAKKLVDASNRGIAKPLSQTELDITFTSAFNTISRKNDSTIIKYSEMTDKDIRSKEIREVLKTGFFKFDTDFGWPAGSYLIIGNTGAGKSWFALSLARQIFLRNDKKTAYFSVEMTPEQIKTRLLQAWSDIRYKDFYDGCDTSKAERLMRKDAITFHSFSKKDNDKYSSPENFEKDFKMFYNAGYRIFMFDHLHEVPGATEMEQNPKVMAKWGTLFKKLEGENTDCWFFIFAQPVSTAAKKKILDMNDIWGSKTINFKIQFIITLNDFSEKDTDGFSIAPIDGKKPITIFLSKNRFTPANFIKEQTYLLDTGNFESTEYGFTKQKFDDDQTWKEKNETMTPKQIQETLNL